MVVPAGMDHGGVGHVQGQIQASLLAHPTTPCWYWGEALLCLVFPSVQSL